MRAVVHMIETQSLGNRGYLVHDGHVAVVIDPPRDIDRVLDQARRARVRITHVFETHVHNDYVSGGLDLARATVADYVLSAEEDVAFDHVGIRDGEIVETGGLTVRALHTPGHTFSHLSYIVMVGQEAMGVFTGGSLLYGSTGRPDLFGPEATPELARAQYRSAHRLVSEVPSQTALYPTHGFGSFCSASQARSNSSTLAAEHEVNPALTLDEADYVHNLLAGLTAYPAYFAHMAPINRAGPGEVDLTPPAVADAAELRRRLDAGNWVVDLRARGAFARRHLPGTVNFGIAATMSSYLGWLLPWGTPLTLLGDTAEQIAKAQRELVHIGIDRPSAMATGDPDTWAGGHPLRSYRVADFAALAVAREEQRQIAVLDVRHHEEWLESHLTAALHVPLHELLDRLGEIPVPPTEVWVHCQAGYRAAIAASLLEADHQVVLIDDDYSNARRAGLITHGPNGAVPVNEKPPHQIRVSQR